MNRLADTTRPRGLFGWWRAASVGWMLDAFDVMLYSMVLASLLGDLNLTKAQGDALSSITLLASAPSA